VLQYANPQVYDHALHDTSWPHVNAIVAGTKSDGTTATTVDAGWATLTLLGKASAADEDMLDGLVSTKLATSLLSQSWLNSGGPLGGYCPVSGHDVLDALELTLPGPDKHVTYVDHAKWAVGKPNGSAWWCALDNNHVASQKKRSGLAVCWEHQQVAALLRAAVTSEGQCGAPPSPPPQHCCFYHDATCTKGMTCCTGNGVSYQSESTCAHYGSKHGCVWEQGKCFIPATVHALAEVTAAH